jgi:hypothetical protein
MQTLEDSIQGSFFQPYSIGSSPIEISPLLKTAAPNEWMMNTLLVLMVILAIFWFVMPNRRSVVQQMKLSLKKPNETVSQIPGFLFTFLFYLNYLIVIVLFIILTIERFDQHDFFDVSPVNLILLSTLAFVAYSLYRLVFIALSGFLFKTSSLAVQQLYLYINLDIKTGFLLLPILLLILTSGLQYFFYFGIFIILIANAIKWFQTIKIGKSTSVFKLYHLIIYLCTLEIIPVLLLYKVIEKLSS